MSPFSTAPTPFDTHLPASPDPEDLSAEFDRFSSELGERLRAEYDCTPPPWHAPADCSHADAFWVTEPKTSEESREEPGACPACGTRTNLPVLCRGCLKEYDRLPDSHLCPYYLPEASCIGTSDEDGYLLIRTTGCGGHLNACHFLAALGRRREGDRP